MERNLAARVLAARLLGRSARVPDWRPVPLLAWVRGASPSGPDPFFPRINQVVVFCKYRGGLVVGQGLFTFLQLLWNRFS